MKQWSYRIQWAGKEATSVLGDELPKKPTKAKAQAELDDWIKRVMPDGTPLPVVLKVEE